MTWDNEWLKHEVRDLVVSNLHCLISKSKKSFLRYIKVTQESELYEEIAVFKGPFRIPIIQVAYMASAIGIEVKKKPRYLNDSKAFENCWRSGRYLNSGDNSPLCVPSMSMSNLSKIILTATGILLSMLLVSCSIQKRTLRPGFHVERIGALNKKTSLQVQAQETANLPVLPNESVGLSYTPLASEALAENSENWNNLEGLAGLAAVTPPQSIESRSVQRELSPVRTDSTGTNLTEGEVALSSDKELMAKIGKAEKVRKLFIWLALLSCPLILTVPFFLSLSERKKSQISALQKEAGLPYRLAWYHSNWVFITLPLFPVTICALTCRLIDQSRLENGKDPLSWNAKTIFFTLVIAIAVAFGGPGRDNWLW